MTKSEKIAGGFWGLLVGDALGVPYEFHSPESIPPLNQIEFVPPAGFSHAYGSLPPGNWSDDGAQALCLLASLLECDGLDLENLATKIAAWYQDGLFAVDNNVFDVGITTSAAIRHFRRGTPAESAGPNSENDNGNGSLMRVLPLALWHQGSDENLARDAMRQSLVTHGHERSQVCCALYCLWARRISQDDSTPFESAVLALRGFIKGDEKLEEQLEFHIRPDDFSPGNGSGYVVDSLRSARFLMREPNYELVVKKAVALGHDTDTTACIAGGVAGLREGISAIPARWLENLRGREVAEPLLEQLLARVGKS